MCLIFPKRGEDAEDAVPERGTGDDHVVNVGVNKIQSM